MNPERLAYWYFRLNGFLTTENFIVHPDRGRQQRTDADLLAVRFKHRQENAELPMVDNERVISCGSLANVIIAEIKTGRCSLNGPWTAPEKANMQRVLQAIGCIEPGDVDAAATALYRSGSWQNSDVTVRLFAIGETPDVSLLVPEAQQLTWGEIIDFCIERLTTFRNQKSSTGQWSRDGLELKRLAVQPDGAVKIRKVFGLQPVTPDITGVSA